MQQSDPIESFLACSRFAVAGASRNRAKYGNKVLRCYQQHDREVVALNPNESEIEGAPCYADLGDVPELPEALSVITPPHVTERVVARAAELGIRHVWLQPGAESAGALDLAREAGLNLIAGGPCLLVVLGYRDQ